MADTATSSDVRPAKVVVYCGVCSLPPEVGTTLSSQSTTHSLAYPTKNHPLTTLPPK
jgi:density-regulated protein DRP1